MNQYNYLKECIQKRVIPFIRQYLADNNYVFWPDQARAHYAESVNYLNKNNLNFVRKNNDNPLNVPERRIYISFIVVYIYIFSYVKIMIIL